MQHPMSLYLFAKSAKKDAWGGGGLRLNQESLDVVPFLQRTQLQVRKVPYHACICLGDKGLLYIIVGSNQPFRLPKYHLLIENHSYI